ncbi:hypothetical protein KBZ21_23140 [Streptomyces sp. A73]|nr:hypothetical protein [Streptomyces sp. RK75]MBQ0862326.1 hypothetical protein [Streptomyces sp. RK75]MBQ1160955.1 hypothetical protein [Streptomyces sp. A73]
MTRDDDMTTGRSAQETAGAGARRFPPLSRSGRPARVVVATAAAPAAGRPPAGCGGDNSDASQANAAPAGRSP